MDAAQFALLSSPEDDRLFEQVVRSYIRSARSSDGIRSARSSDGIRSARRNLRQIYPTADLHRQEGVMVDDVPTEMWFAYRDGRQSSHLTPDPWWDAEGTARAVIDSTGRVHAANSAYRALFGLPAGRGALAVDTFLPSNVRATAGRLSGWFAKVREVTSSTTVDPAWGGRMGADFHAVWDGAGPGRHTLAIRSFADRDDANDQRAIAKSSLVRLSPRVRADLYRGAIRRVLTTGERLVESVTGDPWVVLVVAGVVRLYLSSGGLEPTVRYGTHGSLLGTHWAPPGEDYSMGLQTVTPSILLQLSAAKIEQLVESNAAFAQAILGEGRVLLRDLAESFASHTSASLPQRLAREILLLSELQPEGELIPVTEQQLADGVGCIRESVGRSIADFRRQAWLATTRHGVIVLDPESLRRLAQLDPV